MSDSQQQKDKRSELKISSNIPGEAADSCNTYQVPIGPLHPALKEPIQFSFTLDGEQIADVDLKPGFAHRGIEYMGMRGERHLLQVLYLSERICGICSTSHPVAYTEAVENALEIAPPPRAQYIRTIVAELERIHSHILWAGVAAHELGFDTLLHITWRMREKVMDILEYLTGNRVNYGMFTIGGVRRDITRDQFPKVREALDHYKTVLDEMMDNFLHDPTMAMRTRNVGILPKEDALKLEAVGPTARASGVRKDVRQDQPYLAYSELGVEAITPADFRPTITGDAYDKVVVRLLEVEQSVKLIEECLKHMPPGEIMAETKPAKLLATLQKAGGEGIGRHEAPRGEVFHYIKIEEGKEGPTVWNVRAPTYANLMSWTPMFKGEQIADIPLIAASIDPCMCCMDRVTLHTGDRKEELTKEELIKLSREKTEELRSC
ncbi:MAG: nickel-dependent hydrogenase large subunit [Candidatus Bipolaricaulota bacterium]